MNWLATSFCPDEDTLLFLANVLIQTTVVILVAVFVAKNYLRRRPAAAHAAWLVCLLFVAACPLVLLAASGVGISTIAWSSSRETAPPNPPQANPMELKGAEADRRHDHDEFNRNGAAIEAEMARDDQRLLDSVSPTAAQPTPPIKSSAGSPSTLPPVSLRQYAIALAVVIWLLGVLLLAVRLLHGVIVARKLKHSAVPLNLSAHEDVLTRVRQSSGMTVLPPILASNRIAVWRRAVRRCATTTCWPPPARPTMPTRC